MRYFPSGVIIRHFEYEVTSLVNILFLLLLLYVVVLFLLYQRHKNKVSRRYNDFVALHEVLCLKYPFRIIPQLPPKKAVNGLEFFFFFHLIELLFENRELHKLAHCYKIKIMKSKLDFCI
jgi:hypothetical protein